MRETQKEYEVLLDKFLDTLERNDEFVLTPQMEEQSTYLPRLYTELNGAIDWAMEGRELERFIRAFGEPYPGAFTFLNGEKIHLLKVTWEDNAMTGLNGAVYAVSPDGKIKVKVSQGTLVVEQVMYDGFITAAAQVCKAGDRFVTPQDVLTRARTETPKVKNMCDTPQAFLKEAVR